MNPQADGQGVANIVKDAVENSMLKVDSINLNVDQTLIITTEDKLRLCFARRLNQLQAKTEWTAPLSVGLTLLLTFVTTSFRDSIGLKSADWHAIFVCLFLINLCWLGFTIYRYVKRTSVEDLVGEIKQGTNSARPLNNP